MTEFPSQAPTPELAEAFPTVVPDVEQLVYAYVLAATVDGLDSGIPALSFYADRDRSATEGKKIDVVRGWPAYPGVVPAIGVAAGPEGEDQQHETTQGGFAGQAVLRDDTGQIVAAADYYAEPLTATVLVELIHTNRDERDRLHNELRRVLHPMKRRLPMEDRQVKKVAIDLEKQEQTVGPPVSEEPLEMYITVATVTVHFEMLEATNVIGDESIISRIDAAIAGADSGP